MIEDLRRQIPVVKPYLGIIYFDLAIDGFDQRGEKLLRTQCGNRPGDIPVPLAQLIYVRHFMLC